ncbi:MAG: flavodoxin domain-containing protein [Candidatus Thorarchaeota archaeon]
MKKVIVLYDTVYGNTKKVAMSLSRGLEAGNLYVDCNSIQDFKIHELESYDAVGIGGPTHFHGISKSMKSFLKIIKKKRMENKLGFAFETKGDFHLAGSAGKKIIHYLKRMKLTIIYPPITGIVLNKEGPLEDRTLNNIEQIGLRISEKINNGAMNINKNQVHRKSESPRYRIILNRLKWILVGGGPIFFFIRAIYMASTGGDCFGTINPLGSWFLLLLEIIISGIAGITALFCLNLWRKNKRVIFTDFEKRRLKQFVLIAGVCSYSAHFVRVAIWIILCVI